MAFDFRYPTPLPSTKGWGPGWPNCQLDRIEPHGIFRGGVNKGIKELTDILVEYVQDRGYRFEGDDSWGFGCRATKGGSGEVPSFHSWGLGLDFNAQQNVFGAPASTSRLANQDHWVVGVMRDFGFFWLGPDIGDWMHFSFCGSPEDAKRMTVKARELMKDKRFDDFIDGWKAHRTGGDKPADGFAETGWKFREEAVTKPGAGEHTHPDLARKNHPHTIT